MDAAEYDPRMRAPSPTDVPLVVFGQGRGSEAGTKPRKADGHLKAEIDRLRKRMTDAFLQELSFTADPVIELSRQLDDKINEYMRQTARA